MNNFHFIFCESHAHTWKQISRKHDHCLKLLNNFNIHIFKQEKKKQNNNEYWFLSFLILSSSSPKKDAWFVCFLSRLISLFPVFTIISFNLLEWLQNLLLWQALQSGRVVHHNALRKQEMVVSTDQMNKSEMRNKYEYRSGIKLSCQSKSRRISQD